MTIKTVPPTMLFINLFSLILYRNNSRGKTSDSQQHRLHDHHQQVTFILLNGTVSRDFRTVFFAQKILPGLNVNMRFGFTNIFVFVNIFNY